MGHVQGIRLRVVHTPLKFYCIIVLTPLTSFQIFPGNVLNYQIELHVMYFKPSSHCFDIYHCDDWEQRC